MTAESIRSSQMENALRNVVEATSEVDANLQLLSVQPISHDYYMLTPV